VAQHAVVGEHRALRIRRGARSELDQQDVIRGNVGGSKPFLLGDTVGNIDSVRKADLAHHGAEIDAEKALDVEQRLASRLLQAEIDLRGLEARIDWYGDRADERRAVEEREPLLVVAHQDADPVAMPQTYGRRRNAGHRSAAWRPGRHPD